MLRLQTALVAICLSAGILPAATAPVAAADPLDIPPAVDPGTPVFKGSANPVPDAPVAFDPTKNMLGSIYDADVAAGGDSFWLDRVLERPFKDTSAGERTLLTRGRALYMYTHNPSVLGFAGQGTGANGGGGYAYRQPPTTGTVAACTRSRSRARRSPRRPPSGSSTRATSRRSSPAAGLSRRASGSSSPTTTSRSPT